MKRYGRSVRKFEGFIYNCLGESILLKCIARQIWLLLAQLYSRPPCLKTINALIPTSSDTTVTNSFDASQARLLHRIPKISQGCNKQMKMDQHCYKVHHYIRIATSKNCWTLNSTCTLQPTNDHLWQRAIGNIFLQKIDVPKIWLTPNRLSFSKHSKAQPIWYIKFSFARSNKPGLALVIILDGMTVPLNMDSPTDPLKTNIKLRLCNEMQYSTTPDKLNCEKTYIWTR